jgi:hypothetical protein
MSGRKPAASTEIEPAIATKPANPASKALSKFAFDGCLNQV